VRLRWRTARRAGHGFSSAEGRLPGVRAVVIGGAETANAHDMTAWRWVLLFSLLAAMLAVYGAQVVLVYRTSRPGRTSRTSCGRPGTSAGKQRHWGTTTRTPGERNRRRRSWPAATGVPRSGRVMVLLVAHPCSAACVESPGHAGPRSKPRTASATRTARTPAEPRAADRPDRPTGTPPGHGLPCWRTVHLSANVAAGVGGQAVPRGSSQRRSGLDSSSTSKTSRAGPTILGSGVPTTSRSFSG
jgi:hypothetical protein